MLTNLKLYRQMTRSSLTSFSKELSISVSQLSRIENGKSRGSKKIRNKISNILGVSEENLFGRK